MAAQLKEVWLGFFKAEAQGFLHQNIHDWLGGSWEGKAYSPPSFEPEVVLFVGSLTGLDASPNDPAFCFTIAT